MNVQFKKGVLELVVLKLLSHRDYYGFELVSEVSKEIHMAEGTVYPLLKRLKDEAYLVTYLVESDAGAPRKYYSLTTHGKKTGEELYKEWLEFVEGVNKLLKGE